jgi:hypothetical protein
MGNKSDRNTAIIWNLQGAATLCQPNVWWISQSQTEGGKTVGCY